MVEHRWNDEDARAMQQAAGEDAGAQALALRIYSARLIGSDADLVMHGGGNTSIKLRARDVFGDEIEVIHIKGSGADLGRITATGMPAVRMDTLKRLRALPGLSDEDMVNIHRASLLDSTAPNPSVETLLHAWLPHIVVDHTHATAFLALANLPEAAEATREIFGDRMALAPYIMPGFALAKTAAEIHERHPEAEGLLLLNHGHFTWGPDARASYDRLIAQTNAVEDWLAQRRPGPVHAVAALPEADLAQALPALRGAIGAHLPEDAAMPVFDLRASAEALAFLQRPNRDDLARRGVATPDHVIRTKGRPLVLTRATLAQGPEAIRAAVDRFAAEYHAYFARQAPRFGGTKIELAPTPGLIWIEGAGVMGVGANAAAARIAADIGEQTLRVMADGEAAGGFSPIGEADMFECEYWSLEQAKLGRGAPPPFRGRVVLITGGAGAIGRATAQAFAAGGATIFLVDRDAGALEAALGDLGCDHGRLACDITEPGAAEAAVAACIRRFGGLDILVSNAGAAVAGDVATLPQAVLRQSFELNFFAHFAFAQAATAVFRAQSGARGASAESGQILINVSKQAVNPGRGFAAYGLPKATSLFLLRQLALELGPDGIRVNGVNADRIRSGLLTDDMIAARAAARRVDTETYMAGNLLGREVEARHVAEAFVALAQAERTTAHVMTVDGGNIEAALR
jgi:rhamnose utilization protein RhaD (predicted bifunctional aldolase and dehydrogenase)/NAD(P)-dependent dehydrogenase (short-subunit alcohol dehydrogenase family)